MNTTEYKINLEAVTDRQIDVLDWNTRKTKKAALNLAVKLSKSAKAMAARSKPNQFGEIPKSVRVEVRHLVDGDIAEHWYYDDGACIYHTTLA